MFRTLFFTALFLITASLSHAADLAPKEVVEAYGKALETGDKKAFREVCTGTEDQFKSVNLVLDQSIAIQKLLAVCNRKFGPDNAFSKFFPSLTEKLKFLEIEIDGETAKVHPPGMVNEALTLKKSGNTWKVDLTKLAAQLVGNAESIPIVIKAYDEVASEVADGKIKSADDVMNAMKSKMNANAPPPQAK